VQIAMHEVKTGAKFRERIRPIITRLRKQGTIAAGAGASGS
jgi:hypothetical protein